MNEIKTPLSRLFFAVLSSTLVVLFIFSVVGLLYLGWNGEWLGITGIVSAYCAGSISSRSVRK